MSNQKISKVAHVRPRMQQTAVITRPQSSIEQNMSTLQINVGQNQAKLYQSQVEGQTKFYQSIRLNINGVLKDVIVPVDFSTEQAQPQPTPIHHPPPHNINPVTGTKTVLIPSVSVIRQPLPTRREGNPPITLGGGASLLRAAISGPSIAQSSLSAQPVTSSAYSTPELKISSVFSLASSSAPEAPAPIIIAPDSDEPAFSTHINQEPAVQGLLSEAQKLEESNSSARPSPFQTNLKKPFRPSVLKAPTESTDTESNGSEDEQEQAFLSKIGMATQPKQVTPRPPPSKTLIEKRKKFFQALQKKAEISNPLEIKETRPSQGNSLKKESKKVMPIVMNYCHVVLEKLKLEDECTTMPVEKAESLWKDCKNCPRFKQRKRKAESIVDHEPDSKLKKVLAEPSIQKSITCRPPKRIKPTNKPVKPIQPKPADDRSQNPAIPNSQQISVKKRFLMVKTNAGAFLVPMGGDQTEESATPADSSSSSIGGQVPQVRSVDPIKDTAAPSNIQYHQKTSTKEKEADPAKNAVDPTPRIKIITPPKSATSLPAPPVKVCKVSAACTTKSTQNTTRTIRSILDSKTRVVASAPPTKVALSPSGLLLNSTESGFDVVSRKSSQDKSSVDDVDAPSPPQSTSAACEKTVVTIDPDPVTPEPRKESARERIQRLKEKLKREQEELEIAKREIKKTRSHFYDDED